jgi:hypothetical protein
MDKIHLEDKIKHLQNEIEQLKKAQQTSESTWHHTLTQVVFYGAVASGITSIAHLVVAIINLMKKN